MVEYLIQWMNTLIQTLGKKILTLLPTSPFRGLIDSWVAPQYLGWLNWFMPVGTLITILNLWLAAITLFYLYSIIMRWVNIIGD